MIKIGDTVKVIGYEKSGGTFGCHESKQLAVGSVHKVLRKHRGNPVIEFEGDDLIFLPEDLELVQNPKRHKHADVIHGWAEGAEVEYRNGYSEVWCTCLEDPLWSPSTEYRVKDVYQHLKDALKQGKTIEIKSDYSWVPRANPSFDAPLENYRITETEELTTSKGDKITVKYVNGELCR